MLTLLLIHFLLIIISFGLYTYYIIEGDVPKDHWAAALVILCPILNVLYIYNELRKLFFPKFILWEYILPVLKALGILIGFIGFFILMAFLCFITPLWLILVIDSVIIIILFIRLYKFFKA